MMENPSPQHAWLKQLVGEWEMESECSPGPDQPPQKTVARMHCRLLGQMWLIAEIEGPDPEGNHWQNIMTIGYDPRQECYVGTFVASMMTHLWPYRGVLESDGKKLPLASTGPKFDGSGMGQFRDTIEIVDADHWLFHSEFQGDDGNWNPMMTAQVRRLPG
jgi:hypothetical protein